MPQILVINPDACLRNLLLEVLAEEGYSVVEAHNSYDGLAEAPPAAPGAGLPDVLYLVAWGEEHGLTVGWEEAACGTHFGN